MKKILITGATGFLGKYLLNYFNDMDYELILVGRDIEVIKQLYPNRTAITYENMKSLKTNIDIIIHLAVVNNNQNLSYQSYYDVNVNLYKNILDFALQNSVQKVINMTTLHIFTNKKNNYTDTKKLGLKAEKNFKDLEIYNIFCPMIYGNLYTRKLKLLNLLPSIISKVLFATISSISPVVSSRRVAECIDTLIIGTRKLPRNIYISDNKSRNILFKYFKSFLDISFVIVVIVFFWWIFIIIWLSISFSSKGSAIFSQQRVGKKGK